MFLTWLFPLFLLLPLFSQNSRAPERSEQIPQAKTAAEIYRDTAIRLNELAGNIQTEADAQTLIDAVAEMFAENLPPPWATLGLRDRVAQAEYKAATDARSLIPEERIAKVWNEYVHEIGAADEAIITVDDLHGLRDLKYASAKVMWSRGLNQSIWTMPNLYAVSANGKVADGCRLLEAVATLYDISNFFENLRIARRFAKQGVVASDQIEQAEQRRKSLEQQGVRSKTYARLGVGSSDNPVRSAEQRYITENGLDRMYELLDRLANELLAKLP